MVKMYFGTEHLFLFGYVILEYLDNEFKVYGFKSICVKGLFLFSNWPYNCYSLIFVCLFVCFLNLNVGHHKGNCSSLLKGSK